MKIYMQLTAKTTSFYILLSNRPTAQEHEGVYPGNGKPMLFCTLSVGLYTAAKLRKIKCVSMQETTNLYSTFSRSNKARKVKKIYAKWKTRVTFHDGIGLLSAKTPTHSTTSS